MANKRQLKKQINYLCGELIAECISTLQYNKVNHDDVENVMMGIMIMQDDMICRTSHVQPGMKAKVFFNKLRNDMADQVDEIIDQINGIV